ncbi:hypothetical protein [Bacillus cereus group sp. BfR-BA-02730]|uniref:hypothetical protein n=1 Tax=Bacillus cereus group sp. BfR-BA-02730 TaxID=3094893 RepID=UPI0029C1EA37|nr:hypothetical protein [Bacillus cereus group sp. BfR-BA-02730]MDX5813386.1 hypothetical protein [Bacillus cereus group sp. BfR-BA-02730]
MMQYKHDEKQRQLLQEKINKLKLENSLGSTLSSQVEANLHLIKELEWMIQQKECIEDGYVRLDMVAESIKDKNFRCTPNSMLSADKQ